MLTFLFLSLYSFVFKGDVNELSKYIIYFFILIDLIAETLGAIKLIF